MLCPFCGNNLNLSKRTVERRYNGVNVTILNVPAEVCECGEVFIYERISSNLNYILKSIKLSGTDYEILDYDSFRDLISTKEETSATREACYA